MQSYDDYVRSSQQGTSLYALAKNGDIESTIRILDRKEHDINDKDYKGYAPLMYAAYYGHTDLVRILLARGADPNSFDLNGNSILMGVAFKGHDEIIQLLINAGADLHHRNQLGQTAIDFAYLFGRKKAVEILSGQKMSCPQSVFKSFRSWAKFLKLGISQSKVIKGDRNELK